MEKPITTTLSAIRKHSPCEDGWENLLKYLGKTKADDEPLKFSTIVESNGVDDALWCLRSLGEDHYGKIRLLAADCAESVLHIYEKEFPNDDRPRNAIEAARGFANGKITEEELIAAAGAVRGAAGAARDAARDAWAAWSAGQAAEAARLARAARAAEKKLQAGLLIKYFG
jgi:hypothetical protein